jgi:circadian clock protein KaiC
VLALQVACHRAREGDRTVYFAVEERPEDLVLTGDSLGFDTSALVADGSLVFGDLRRQGAPAAVVTGEYDTEGLIHRLVSTARAAEARILVIDSVSALFNPRPPEQALRSHFFALVNGLEEGGFTTLLTTEAAADYARLVLVLRNVVDGKRRRRTIEVHKYRRSGHQKGEYAATVTDAGMTIFPLDSAAVQARDFPSTDERFSSGMRGLDEMNSGGWLRDSIVLVRGPSGSGKTTLAGMYARAGAKRGERVVYYGFEEPRPVLLRNFAALGLTMEELEEAGTLRFVCRYPEATSPEDLLVDLRRDLDEFDPTLVVLDSISSVEHSTSTEGFRIFLIGLASLLRERARSALLTQTISSQAEARQDPPFLSTVADAILMLDYTADAPDLERTMRVLKMRGSSHETRQRRLVIQSGGLRVEPLPGDGG